MAAKKTDETQDTASTPTAEPTTGPDYLASVGAPYRLLVNPSGNTVAFALRDPKRAPELLDAYEEHLYMQRPPTVKPDKWFREPTVDEAKAFVAAHPWKK